MATYDELVALATPVGYWPLAGNANDTSGNGRNGTINSGPLTNTTLPNTNAAYAFNGTSQYIEIADNNAFSVPTTGVLAVEAWMRPDVLEQPTHESTGYTHWIGKGTSGQNEWTGRMYSLTTTDTPPRPNRISGYCFNLSGSQGNGSYFQDVVTAGQWIHWTLVINMANTSSSFPAGYVKIFKNGQQRDQDSLVGITPQNGTAPVRIGTRNFGSFFQGAIGKVAIYDYEPSIGNVLARYENMIGGSVANYNAVRSKHQTLVANVVDIVTLAADSQFVEISNWGATRIYFTVDGSTPTVAGDETFCVGPGGSLQVSTGGPALEAYKLVSAGACDYSVQAVYDPTGKW